MRNFLLSTLLLLCSAHAINTIDFRANTIWTLGDRDFTSPADPNPFPEFTEHYSTNKFNHFDPTESRTYQQRYFQSDKYFDKENGPIFVYICGEYTCEVPTTRMFPYAMVQEHKAIYYVVEHRYYGKSQLFEDWSVPNMKLLTAELGLADLAYFITTKQAELAKKYNTTKPRKVITIGGSYPGAMSAWFRYKYPHVTDGSLSSSGVIRPLLDFWKFDEQINKSMALTPGCLEIAGSWVKTIYEHLSSKDDAKRNYILKIFGAGDAYDTNDFMVYVNGIFVEHVQYGTRTDMCDYFVSLAKETLDSQLKFLAKYGGPAGPDGVSGVQSTKIDFEASGRQWNWQVCTNMGWLFTPSPGSKLTPASLDLNYWIDYCNRVFGPDIKMNPKVGIDDFNILYGREYLRGSNIFFTNGVEDGWQFAGHRETLYENTSMTSHVVDCENCAHCVDLYTEKASDAADLKQTRMRIRMHVATWLTGDGFPENSGAKNFEADDGMPEPYMAKFVE